MGYTGARVGEALSRGFAGIGDALYAAAQNAEQRRRYEATNAENQRRYEAGVAWDEQREATRQAEYGQQIEQDRRDYLANLAAELPGAMTRGVNVPEARGSLVAPGGAPVPGTETVSPADFLANPEGMDYQLDMANYDPRQTQGYKDQEIENTQELTHMAARADMMAGRDPPLTYSGGRLAGPTTPEGPPKLTFDQALKRVYEMYPPTFDDVTGEEVASISPNDAYNLAQKMASGDVTEGDFQIGGAGVPPGEAVVAGTGPEEEKPGWGQRLKGFFGVGDEGAVAADELPEDGPLTEAEIEEARADMEKDPNRDWLQTFTLSGFSEDEIRRIMGG